ncbi:hypothetical protein HORIV_36860 [Vreelandella olivaria]|uniref:Putative regulatory protein FmdB zinc ribbon domain-containing protein n=1 Tax=Vreelandella olivaria TaxID=390919 RepID=A0ABN5WWL7_9GAMM|nr:hypothetical protein HORIV_36860 [Halomonas olivaria]
MPIYEYECKACGHRMEKLQKISADPLKDCPACQSDGLERLVSAAGFRLAGGGWYETDFKTGSKRTWSLMAKLPLQMPVNQVIPALPLRALLPKTRAPRHSRGSQSRDARDILIATKQNRI